MKKLALISVFSLALAVGISGYFLYEYPKTVLREVDSSSVPAPESVLQAPPTHRQADSPVPSSPPRTTDAPFAAPNPEPQRTLLGDSNEQQYIEESLPVGARLATYPVDNIHLKPALLNTKLDGDSKSEMVVAYLQGGVSDREATSQLFLGVLAHEGAKLRLLSTIRLADGGVLFNIDSNSNSAPIVAEDITGDGQPEILVASGIGASLGGTLQVFSVNGTDIHQLAEIGGHFFRVQSHREGKPVEISVRSKYGDKSVIYKWIGQKFEAIN